MISTNLTFLRKSKRLSLEDVADAIHVSRQAVSKWESGETTPDLINTIALAKFYDVSIDALVSIDTQNNDGKYVFGMVTMGERGQIVIPKKARDIFQLNPGDNLIVLGDTHQGGIALAKVNSEDIEYDFFMGGNTDVSNQDK